MKVFAALTALASAETYFEETFSTLGDKWVTSEWKGPNGPAGTWTHTSGLWSSNEQEAKGIATTTDFNYHCTSAKLDKPFSSKDKTLVLQFSVKHEKQEGSFCGGGYIKLLGSDLDQKNFGGDSPYNIMFGPDICGYSTKKVHVIFGYKGQNLLTKKDIPCESDELSHLYTLIVNPDNTYEVRIDGEKKHDGSLYDDFDFLEPKEINDPAVSKPADWVDETHIDDPEDVKPDDWVEETHIADPEAAKPEDWDDEMDGEWEAPQIDNPEYKGAFSAKRIENPAYKGEWVHPQVANPDFVNDEFVYKFDDFGAIGFDLWQVKSGTIFDDLLITDSVEEAEAAVPAFQEIAAAEKAAKEEADAAAAKAAEEAAAAAEAEKEDEAGDEEAADEEAKDEL